MKRIAMLIAAMTMLLAVNISAEAKGRAGIVGGFTSSRMSLKDVSFKNASGFNAGVAFNQPLLLGFSIQPELIYNVKATSLQDVKANFNLGYVEVPVQVQWGIDVLNVARVYAFAEPFIGYAVSGKVNVDSMIGGGTRDIINNIKNKLEYGFGIGAGAMLIDHVQISFKYYWNLESSDLKDIVEEVKGKIGGASSFNGLVISAGIFF